jgi:hypothetical protein
VGARWTAAVAGAAGEGSWARVERRLLRASGCFAAAVGGVWACAGTSGGSLHCPLNG